MAERWQCPICAQSVTTFVPVSDEPRCHRHLRRVVRMVLVDQFLEEANRG